MKRRIPKRVPFFLFDKFGREGELELAHRRQLLLGDAPPPAGHLKLRFQIAADHRPVAVRFAHGELMHHGLAVTIVEDGAQLMIAFALPRDSEAAGRRLSPQTVDWLVLLKVAVLTPDRTSGEERREKEFVLSRSLAASICYARLKAATPGNSRPARNSSDAPPPVEICEILSATPADLIAFSESPPPTTLTAPESATALARATVPRSKGGISNTPIGPFQMIVRAPLMTVEYASMVRGPISSPIIPSGTRLATWFAAPAFISEATT